MSSYIPQIRFKYGWLLASVTSGALNDKYGNGDALGTFEELSDVAVQYERWWAPYNEQILNGLCDIMKLSFRQNIIDVYVSPWFTPISDPMVLGPAFESQDELINIVAHELIHRLLTDNTLISNDHNYLEDWRNLYGEIHDRNTLVHIPVHAVLKKLYLDELERPDLLRFDIERTKNNKPYSDAWRYVESNNYNDIIETLSISKSQ